MIAIELFSCSGGMAEGFRRAGIRFDHVFDRDPNAVDSYATNLGHLPEAAGRSRAIRSTVSLSIPPHEIGRPVRVRPHRDHAPATADEPAKTITRNSHGDGALVRQPKRWHRSHPPSEPDSPARTLTTVDTGGSGVLVANRKHPINRADRPSHTVTARDHGGAQGSSSCEWPWDRPATTVQCDDRIAPPGHHKGSDRSAPNAIVLSERARKILQGFPETWVFSGATKKARNAQLGQAMPPPLAHAVAESVRRQLEAS